MSGTPSIKHTQRLASGEPLRSIGRIEMNDLNIQGIESSSGESVEFFPVNVKLGNILATNCLTSVPASNDTLLIIHCDFWEIDCKSGRSSNPMDEAKSL